MNEKEVQALLPGMFVINKNQKNWGIGQIQSSINDKITINFEHVGKKVININNVPIEVINDNEFN